MTSPPPVNWLARRRALPTLAMTLATTLAMSCGIPADREPRPIAADEIPEALRAPTTVAAADPDDVEVTIYGITSAEGEPTVLARTTTQASSRDVVPVVKALLDYRPEEGQPASSIPPGTTLVDFLFDEDQGVLTLDLSEELASQEGPLQIQAIAQIVFTATETPDVAAVQFKIEGEAKPIPLGDGGSTSDPVDRDDYAALDPEANAPPPRPPAAPPPATPRPPTGPPSSGPADAATLSTIAPGASSTAPGSLGAPSTSTLA